MQLKVGDCVRTLSNHPNNTRRSDAPPVGSVGWVNRLGPIAGTVHVVLASGSTNGTSTGWWYNDNQLEKVDD